MRWLHVFDVSGLPQKAPVWKQYIKTSLGKEKDATGQLVYGEDGIYGQPGWIMTTIDGRYLYPETGEIIDTHTKTILRPLPSSPLWLAQRSCLHSMSACES